MCSTFAQHVPEGRRFLRSIPSSLESSPDIWVTLVAEVSELREGMQLYSYSDVRASPNGH